MPGHGLLPYAGFGSFAGGEGFHTSEAEPSAPFGATKRKGRWSPFPMATGGGTIPRKFLPAWAASGMMGARNEKEALP